jgi:hypothetical protein
VWQLAQRPGLLRELPAARACADVGQAFVSGGAGHAGAGQIRDAEHPANPVDFAGTT